MENTERIQVSEALTSWRQTDMSGHGKDQWARSTHEKSAPERIWAKGTGRTDKSKVWKGSEGVTGTHSIGQMDKSVAWKESEGVRGTYLLESTGWMALMSWRVQTDGQVRTRKESRWARGTYEKSAPERIWGKGTHVLESAEEGFEGARVTHVLVNADGWTCQDMERIRGSEGCSRPRECRGKNLRKGGSLMFWWMHIRKNNFILFLLIPFLPPK